MYLNNRTPREQNWKTPIETLNNWLRSNGRDMAVAELQDKPDLTNLYAYGCCTYPLKTAVLRDELGMPSGALQSDAKFGPALQGGLAVVDVVVEIPWRQVGMVARCLGIL